MKQKPAKQRQYAAVGNPTINAVVKSLYRYANEKQAIDRLAQLKEHFVTSKQSGMQESDHALVMWIRGYELTAEETAQGFAGNYASITIGKDDGKYTLTAKKLDAELRFHPQKKREKQKHPDWGHPILRDIKKKRIYFTAEEASDELARLHEEFPEVSIPSEGMLMIILYEKQEGVKSPVQKYKLTLKALPEGGFIIQPARNNKPIKSKLPGAKEAAAEGYFSAMVKTKARKKPEKPAT